MDHVGWLSDVYGPRLTGSPGFEQAADWAMKRLTDWGLGQRAARKWKFGKGWSLTRFNAHLIEPQVQPLIGYPKAWTPGTNGHVTGDVVRVAIGSDADFEKYRGKLSGKIVLSQPAREVRMLEGRIVLADGRRRCSRKRAGCRFRRRRRPAPRRRAGPSLADKTLQFFLAEGVAAVLRSRQRSIDGGDGRQRDLSPMTAACRRRHDLRSSGGGPRDENAGKVPPQVTLAVEHYNRMVRVLDRGLPVKVELDIQAQFHDETDTNGFNVIAEISRHRPGERGRADRRAPRQLALRSGATDNAAGVAVMMEAMRILKTVGAKPRRTIRVALWGGEEQGLLGSRAYVRSTSASRGAKPEHQKLAAYYNVDNGTGRIRGVWMQGNVAIAPIFGEWTAGAHDLQALATDVAGNAHLGAIQSLTIDNTAPTIAITTPIAGNDVVNASEDNTVVVSGTTSGVEDGQTVTVTFSDGSAPDVVVTATVTGNAWTASAADISGLDNGPISVTADVSDLAGNPASDSESSRSTTWRRRLRSRHRSRATTWSMPLRTTPWWCRARPPVWKTARP